MWIIDNNYWYILFGEWYEWKWMACRARSCRELCFDMWKNRKQVIIVAILIVIFPFFFSHIYIFLIVVSPVFRVRRAYERKKGRSKKKEEREVERKKKRNVCYSFSSDFRWSTYRESTMTSDNNIDNTIDVFFLFLNGIKPYLYILFYIKLKSNKIKCLSKNIVFQFQWPSMNIELLNYIWLW